LTSVRIWLLEVLSEDGRVRAWQEWRASDPKAPSLDPALPHPVVMIDGAAVLSGEFGREAVQDVIRRSSRTGPRSAIPGTFLPLVGLVALIVPKCPLCFAMWLAVLGIGGLSGPLHMLARGTLVFSAAAFVVGARYTGRRGPLILGTIGAAIALGPSADASAWFRIVDGALLASAAAWNAISVQRRRRRGDLRPRPLR
jgi:hypothetical protein